MHFVGENREGTNCINCAYTIPPQSQSNQKHSTIPQEGPLIPSYLCVRNWIKEVAVTVVNNMICQKLCEFYATKGDLIVYPDFDVPPSQHENEIYFTVDSHWLKQLYSPRIL